ncbi:MAG TPA: hypothetical protein VIS76_05025 [Pseudomonadales bacterium]
MSLTVAGQWLIRVAVALLFAGWLGYCSNSPPYRHLGTGLSTIMLSVHHAGQVLGTCRERSAEELAALPENMRAPLVCPRERSPLVLELLLDGRTMFSETLAARGVHHDGRASVYRRLTVTSGEVDVLVRLKDHVDQETFPYVSRLRTDLRPGANLVIDFDSDAGRFVFLNGGEVDRGIRPADHPEGSAG